MPATTPITAEPVREVADEIGEPVRSVAFACLDASNAVLGWIAERQGDLRAAVDEQLARPRTLGPGATSHAGSQAHCRPTLAAVLPIADTAGPPAWPPDEQDIATATLAPALDA